jgi:IS1 family transposase
MKKAVLVYTLSHEQEIKCLHLLVEGNSLRSIHRLTGIHRDTVARLMVRVGTKLREFLDGRMRNLNLTHLQCDEIWTFCLKKQAKLSIAESLNTKIGDQYLFIALDEETKLIPSFVLGKRTAENAQMLMQDLSERIITPELLDPSPRPKVSTDGFNAYPGAVEMAFATTVDYGVLIKDYSNSEQPGRYGPPEMVGAVRQVIQGTFSKFEICTSHVERHNLSIRTFMRRFTRLALGFSKKVENLAACTCLYIAYYNFCWLHGSLPGTPAMAAGIAGHPWTLEELLSEAGAI